ncbi:MAG: phospholipase D family protein [Steroidobacteraceae bacterium]
MNAGLRRGSLIVAASLLLLSACATAPPAVANRAASRALPDPEDTHLGGRFLQRDAHGELSGYRLLSTGIDGLAARVEIIRAAERTLDLQYYIFRGDQAGLLVARELRRAADRGVRIRLLVDDGDTAPGDEQILLLDGYRNIEVRVFNPFDSRTHNLLLRNLDFLLHRARLDYRMHNKLLVCDNAIALVGGRNIGNQYFQIDPGSQFADDDVFVAGRIVPTLSRSFDDFWNSDMSIGAAVLLRTGSGSRAGQGADEHVASGTEGGYQVRIDSGEPLAGLLDGRTPLVWTSARVVYDSPDKKRVERRRQHGRLMSAAVNTQIAAVQRELLMVSPYFVPSQGELAQLRQLRQQGAGIRVLSNSLESAPNMAAYSGYQKVRVPLLQEGVELYEVRALIDDTRGSGQGRRVSRYGNYALHAKLYVFDRARLFVGSWNYDQRSLRINTEIGLIIESDELAGEVAGRFEQMTRPQEAYHVVLKTTAGNRPALTWNTEINHLPFETGREPARGWWQRLRVRLLALLPLQPEL